jgi:hypothetical protein
LDGVLAFLLLLTT